MIGTTRSRVSFFMNKFRKLGLISYNGKIEVHNSLLNAVLYDKPEINRDLKTSRKTDRVRFGLIDASVVICRVATASPCPFVFPALTPIYPPTPFFRAW